MLKIPNDNIVLRRKHMVVKDKPYSAFSIFIHENQFLIYTYIILMYGATFQTGEDNRSVVMDNKRWTTLKILSSV